MNNIDTKIVGYGLLILGLIFIFLSAVNVYTILNGSARSFTYFDFKPIEISLDSIIDTGESANLSNQQNMPKFELIPKEVINETTNLIAHLFLLGMLVSIGARIATIGVYLIRPINVNLSKEKDA